ncbi:hypothetical protein [Listeria welshimeri]|uniref:hypothetical protein n=1 Tax=Listeria welshimeri TaxID=1643 RepID=UPI0016246807|nr:hypothetical protein [Listeria welshimeri]MBC1342336.1 hypothetical protein [Listeria welshimeri]MBC1350769.1 hypothetical protein [Listeria welshimeri]MBF2342543.1 hypothetical protein [Listeria welshimeri]
MDTINSLMSTLTGWVSNLSTTVFILLAVVGIIGPIAMSIIKFSRKDFKGGSIWLISGIIVGIVCVLGRAVVPNIGNNIGTDLESELKSFPLVLPIVYLFGKQLLNRSKNKKEY